MNRALRPVIGTGWIATNSITLPHRKETYFSFDDLHLATEASRLLRGKAPNGVYRHQHEAIRRVLSGENVCLATGTASGKTLPFMAAAIERLVQDPSAKVVAIYPLRALGQEQEDRWRDALQAAGVSAVVGRIDGQVRVPERIDILRNSSVLILTPDIIHAWLLSNLSSHEVLDFLRHLSLVIIDEVHNYAGVFGSNSALLFRRLRYALGLLGTHPQYICASATIADPRAHLNRLLDLDFSIIGENLDTSPRHEIEVSFLEPPRQASLLLEIAGLLRHTGLLGSTDGQTISRFIAFVDSRKQTEYLASVLAQTISEEQSGTDGAVMDHLRQLQVLPYRSGYEEYDRTLIQNRLSSGQLRGVVSTSALELGLDIPYLDTAMLVGVPHSATSLQQRIGRIGRHSDGRVLVINSGDEYDNSIFRDPEQLLHRPLSESSLYLENARVQYIHALCLAREGGEHDRICEALGSHHEHLQASSVNWPEGFPRICEAERSGDIPGDLRVMKVEAGADPNHTFPLRDVESQFKVQLRQGPRVRSLGSLTFDQLMREAYAGAVYYYTSKPFRVYRLNMRSRIVQVRPEKRYNTRPISQPTQLFPDLTSEGVFRAAQYGELTAIECKLLVRESLSGFVERRGPNEFACSYPVDATKTGVYFGAARFTRNYFTTGVLLSHPALEGAEVDRSAIASLLCEAFLAVIPLQSHELGSVGGQYRSSGGAICPGKSFVAIYDQTYGSLRLSGRLFEDSMLNRVIDTANRLATGSAADFTAILSESTRHRPRDITPEDDLSTPSPGQTRIVLPGSVGLCLMHGNGEFLVEELTHHPSQEGPCYRGQHVESGEASSSAGVVREIIPLHMLSPIPGESALGLYDHATDQIEER